MNDAMVDSEGRSRSVCGVVCVGGLNGGLDAGMENSDSQKDPTNSFVCRRFSNLDL